MNKLKNCLLSQLLIYEPLFNHLIIKLTDKEIESKNGQINYSSLIEAHSCEDFSTYKELFYCSFFKKNFLTLLIENAYFFT